MTSESRIEEQTAMIPTPPAQPERCPNPRCEGGWIETGVVEQGQREYLQCPDCAGTGQSKEKPTMIPLSLARAAQTRSGTTAVVFTVAETVDHVATDYLFMEGDCVAIDLLKPNQPHD